LTITVGLEFNGVTVVIGLELLIEDLGGSVTGGWEELAVRQAD
jgi:hypothetical protein